jgi:DNA-binding transcriptional MerR regulator
MYELFHCERKGDTTLYKIGLFSQINRVTIKALRYYDEISLLKPEFIDRQNGYRYYTSQQLPILHRILALRQMGFTIDEIKLALDGTSEEELLKKKRSELLRRIAEDTTKLSQVEGYLLHKDTDREFHVILKELPEVTVASMRKVIPGYSALCNVIPLMGTEMERIGCSCSFPDYCYNIYHEGWDKGESVDVEICQAVTEKKQHTDLLIFKVVPRVETAACVLHKGSYEEIPKAYAAVLRWIEDNGYEMIDYPRESYIDGDWNKDTPEEWLTEIQFPVQKKL